MAQNRHGLPANTVTEGIQMIITDFTHVHIEEALILAISSYAEEHRHVPILPSVDMFPDLASFADNGLGVAAIENEIIVGFMCYRALCIRFPLRNSLLYSFYRRWRPPILKNICFGPVSAEI